MDKLDPKVVADPQVDPPVAEIEDPALRAVLAGLTDPPGPAMGAALRRRAHAPPRVALAAALLLAGVAVALAPRVGALRARGGGVDPGVELAWLIEDAAGARRGRDPTIEPGQQVIFRVQTRGGGYLCLQEESTPGRWVAIVPDDGDGWRVGPGQHLPAAGGQTLAYRTDAGPGRRSYRALLDPEDPRCGAPVAADVVELEWLK